jgi:hypothetical protein
MEGSARLWDLARTARIDETAERVRMDAATRFNERDDSGDTPSRWETRDAAGIRPQVSPDWLDFPSLSRGPANGSLTQPRRGPVRQRQSGAPLAATNVKTAGSVCKRRDAVHLGRKEGLQPRPNERPAVGCSEKLGRARVR